MTRSHRPILASLALALSLFLAPAPRAETAADDGTGEMILGKPDAPILIIEYLRMTCSACAAFHTSTYPKLKEAYIDKGLVKIAFREFPGNQQDPISGVPAMMARCAGKDRYFALIELLFANFDKWTKASDGRELINRVFVYGRLAGMTQEQLDGCLKNERLFKAMQARWAEGEKQHRGTTPYFIIGDQELVGVHPLTEFDKILKPMIERLPKRN